MMDRNFTIRYLVFSAFLLVCTSCAKGPYTLNLMPAPEVYDEESINPFTDNDPLELHHFGDILYATDREPAGPDDNEKFYVNDRGHVLRLGKGIVEIGRKDITWEEARQISLLKNRPGKYPLKITDAKEIGMLDRTLSFFMDPASLPADPHKPAQEFASLINEKLSISKRKDIYVYVPGFKVVFENPLLVATELWHFLGYDGVFIAYSWPSTPKNLAYFSDLETASYSVRNFRHFLKYIAEETAAERIHIIGYSAGTRVVADTLALLALEKMHKNKSTIQQELHIGHVILTGSDIDRDIFGGYLEDGLLNVVDTLTIYMSKEDKALGFSKWLFGRQRLGQISKDDFNKPAVRNYLLNNQSLIIINATDAAEATSGNGHAYFRKSPWVSSDILMTLMFNLAPGERALTRENDSPIWTFPDNYIDRLRQKLIEHVPDFEKPVNRSP